MANINLVTVKEEDSVLGTGTVVLLIVLLVAVLTYVGLIFYGNKLKSDRDRLKQEYAERRESFATGESRKVLDFQNRLTVADKLLAEERDSNKDIGKIEEAMRAGVRLGSYKYDATSKTITLDCFADNYETVATQILSFKSSDYFSSVLAGETKFDAKSSKINFPVILTIK